MASFNLLRLGESRFESPAKVFERLKYEVRKEVELHAGENGLGNKTATIWLGEELNENQTIASNRNETYSFDLSSIPGSVKTLEYSAITSRPQEERCLGKEHGPREVLESTALSKPCSSFNGGRIEKGKLPNINRKILIVPDKTPMKEQFEKTHEDIVYNPLSKHASPKNRFSLATRKLRKTQSERQEFIKDCGLSKESQPDIQPQQKILTLDCRVVLEKLPVDSSAKGFACRREKLSKRNQHKEDVETESRSDIFNYDHTLGDDEVEDVASSNSSENVVSDNPSVLNSTNCQSHTDRSEESPIPAAPPKPLLLEDPLVFNSPQVIIPKTNETNFKRNCWSKQRKFPQENVVYLKKWFLDKTSRGLYVHGIHKVDNIMWNSNIIVERISDTVLKTITGKIYILIGKMKMKANCDFPDWLLKKFSKGFPPNWKAIYEQYLQDLKAREKKKEKAAVQAKPLFEVPSIDWKHTQTPVNTSEFRSPASVLSTYVSRSGRIIKPPLEYWRGGRVSVDAHMNVTIHECYDTYQSGNAWSMPKDKGPKESRSAKTKTAKDDRTQPQAEVVKSVSKPNKDVPCREKRSSPSVVVPIRNLRITLDTCDRRTRSNQKQERVSPAHQKWNKSSACRSKQATENITPPLRTLRRRQTRSSSPESPLVNHKTPEPPSSEEEIFISKKKQVGKVHVKNQGKNHKESKPDPKTSVYSKGQRKAQVEQTRKPSGGEQSEQKESTKNCEQLKPLLKSKQSSKIKNLNKNSTVTSPDEDKWTEAELEALRKAVSLYPNHMLGYWTNVARMVGTRSAEECHKQHTTLGAWHSPVKKAKKKPPEAKPSVPEKPVVSARVGTLKRKEQVRQFLKSRPREDVDDAFSSAYMQKKRFEMPSFCPSDDPDIHVSDLEPTTPKSSHFPEAKTPQCLYLTPGMMGSPNAHNGDKYVYQLQKRMKNNQVNVCKNTTKAKFTPSPALKRQVKRFESTDNDQFVVWEMLGEKAGDTFDSEEEEDFYFSDN